VKDMRLMFENSKFNGNVLKWKFNRNVKLTGFIPGINSLKDINKLKLGKFRRLLNI